MAELSRAPGAFATPGVSHNPLSDRRRRIIGGAYGLVLGVVYAFTSGTINWLVLRDVPLRLDWSNVLLSTLVTGVLGLVLGVIVAWPESFVQGVIAGALAISIGGTVQALVTREISFALTVALLLTLLSRAALNALIALPLRMLIHWQEETGFEAGGGRLRYWLPAGAVVLGLFFGSLSQMPPEAKAAVRQTHRLIQNALQAQTAEAMPPALRRVPDFQARASATYVLDQRLEQFSFDRLYNVTVYFDNGFVVSCLYPPTGSPACDAGEG